MTVSGDQLRIAYKNPCRVATTGTIADWTTSAPLVVDTVTLVAGDRVLVRAQSQGQYNGIYRVVTPGSGSNGTWVRADDFDETNNDRITAGLQVYIQDGSANGGKEFRLTTLGSIVLDTTVLIFTDVTPPSMPLSSIDNSLPRFDGTTGLIIQGGVADNNVILDDLGNLYPQVNDGGGLGTATYKWSDLFLASGAVVNFNSNVTLTHSAGTLAFAGASTGGYIFDAAVVPASAGAGTLGGSSAGWADLYLNTNGSIRFASDVSIIHSSNTLTFSGASTGYLFEDGPLASAGHENLGTTTNFFGSLYLSSTGAVLFGSSNVYISAGANSLEFGGATDTGYRFDAPLFILERASALADFGNHGQIWVKSDSPNTLWFTDETGVDYQISGSGSPTGTIDGSTGSLNNALIRADGTGGHTIQGGAASNSVYLDDNGNLYPQINDGGTLGAALNGWSDLFLASGAVINFNADVTVTHSSGALAFAGAENGYSFDDNVDITNATNPTLSLYEVANSQLRIFDAGTTQAVIDKITESGAPLLDFNAIPTDGTSSASIRMFRSTSTSGLVRFFIHKGDGTATSNHVLVGQGGDSYLVADNGDLGIGSVDNPKEKLEVFGGVAMDYARIDEQSAAPTTTASNGAFWVKDDAPNTPKFTDDAGTDWSLLTLSGGGSGTTNAIAKWTGTAGGLTSSGVTIDGSNNIQFPASTARLAWGAAGYAYIESDGGLTADMIISSTDQIHFKPGVWTGSGKTIIFDANGNLIDTQSIVPEDSTKDLGSASNRWANLYMASTIDIGSDLTLATVGTPLAKVYTATGHLQLQVTGGGLQFQGGTTTSIVPAAQRLHFASGANMRFYSDGDLSFVMDTKTFNVASQTYATTPASAAGWSGLWSKTVTGVSGPDVPMFLLEDGGVRAALMLGGQDSTGDLTPFMAIKASNALTWSEVLEDDNWTHFPTGSGTVVDGYSSPRGDDAAANINWTSAGIALRQTVTGLSGDYTISFWAGNVDHTNGNVTVSLRGGSGVAVTITSTWARYEIAVTAGSSNDYFDLSSTGTGNIRIFGLQVTKSVSDYRKTMETAQSSLFGGLMLDRTLMMDPLYFIDEDTWIRRTDPSPLTVLSSYLDINSNKPIRLRSASLIGFRPYSAAKEQITFTSTGIKIAAEGSSTEQANIWMFNASDGPNDLRYTDTGDIEYSFFKQAWANNGDVSPYGGFGPNIQNLFYFSEEMNQASYWTSPASATITANAATAPNGYTQADQVYWGAGAGIGLRQIVPGTPFTTSSYYRVSFWAKAVTGTPTITVDIRDGAAQPVTLDANWHRYSVLCQAGAGGSHWVDFTGGNGDNVYFWGMQVQDNTSYGPYIKTRETPVDTARNGWSFNADGIVLAADSRIVLGEDSAIYKSEPTGFTNFLKIFSAEDISIETWQDASITATANVSVTSSTGDISIINSTGGQTLHLDSSGRSWFTNGTGLRWGDSGVAGIIGSNATSPPYIAAGADSGGGTGNLYCIGGGNVIVANTLGSASWALGKHVAKFDVVNEAVVIGFNAADRSAAQPLDVMDAIRLTPDPGVIPATTTRIEWETANTYISGPTHSTETGTTYVLRVNCTDTSGEIHYVSAEDQVWYDDGTEVMRLDAANDQLYLKNNYDIRLMDSQYIYWDTGTGVTNYITALGGGNTTIGAGGDIVLNANDDVFIQDSGSSWAHFDTGVKGLAVGATHPGTSNDRLYLKQAAAADNTIRMDSYNGNRTYFFQDYSDSDALAVQCHAHIKFWPNGSEAARFSVTNGNLLIGGTSDLTGICKLQVYGASTGSGGNPIVYFQNSASSLISNKTIQRLHFSGDAGLVSTDHWIEFMDGGSAIVGSINSEVVYTPFTGSHIGQNVEDMTEGIDETGYYDEPVTPGTKRYWKPGMIVVSTGVLADPGSISNSFTRLNIASTAQSKAVMGVFTDGGDNNNQKYTDPDMLILYYNAVGEGKVLVTDKGGNVDLGDYIESSTIEGYGQVQSDDILHSYTVAKCIEQVDWSSVTDTIDEGGNTYKWVLIACTYHCG